MNKEINEIDCMALPCNENTKWLTTEEAAAFLKIDKGTLLNYVSNGMIPYYKLGRRNRYLQSELDQLLKTKPKGERLWEFRSTS